MIRIIKKEYTLDYSERVSYHIYVATCTLYSMWYRDPASSGQSERWNVKNKRKNVVLAN